MTVRNIEKCVHNTISKEMWKVLHMELRLPPRDPMEEIHTLCGIKTWLLIDSSASWQKLSIALYSSSLDGALKQLKYLNFLPSKGMDGYPTMLVEMIILHSTRSIYKA